MARGEEPGRAPPGSTSDGPENEQVEAPQRPRGHRVVQEEDGESFVEYLPPQYREAWQAGPEPGQSPPTAPEDSPGPYSGSGSQELAALVTAPVAQDPALKDKVRTLNAERPQLKQEYKRAFGRALPRPPQSPPTSGFGAGSQSGTDAESSERLQSPSSAGDLRADYKRQLGSSVRSSSAQESQHASGDLRDDYKRQLGPDTPGSQAGPLSLEPTVIGSDDASAD